MKTTAILINTGRGDLINEEDLLAALNTNKIAAAGLDVTKNEPPALTDTIWQLSELPNVIITPHVAGNGSNRNRHMLVLQENLRRFLAGDALLNVVDPELGY